MNYRLSRKADQDIQSIAEFGIERFGVTQARAYHDVLFNVFDLIGQNPEMGREHPELSGDIRVHPHGPHIILYRDDDEGVLIVRVRHSREDWITDPV